MFQIYTPWKHQKTKGFLFSGAMGALARNGLIKKSISQIYGRK